MSGFIRSINRVLGAFPHDIVALLARIVVGLVFFKSGLNKIDGVGVSVVPPSLFNIKSSTFFLFQNEWHVPVLPPTVSAYLATHAELLLPPLLIAGVLTRLTAVPLLLMTLVIQTFVYPASYVLHGLWAVVLLTLIAHGPGRLSLDYVLGLDGRK